MSKNLYTDLSILVSNRRITTSKPNELFSIVQQDILYAMQHNAQILIMPELFTAGFNHEHKYNISMLNMISDIKQRITSFIASKQKPFLFITLFSTHINGYDAKFITVGDPKIQEKLFLYHHFPSKENNNPNSQIQIIIKPNYYFWGNKHATYWKNLCVEIFQERKTPVLFLNSLGYSEGRVLNGQSFYCDKNGECQGFGSFTEDLRFIHLNEPLQINQLNDGVYDDYKQHPQFYNLQSLKFSVQSYCQKYNFKQISFPYIKNNIECLILERVAALAVGTENCSCLQFDEYNTSVAKYMIRLDLNKTYAEFTKMFFGLVKSHFTNRHIPEKILLNLQKNAAITFSEEYNTLLLSPNCFYDLNSHNNCFFPLASLECREIMELSEYMNITISDAHATEIPLEIRESNTGENVLRLH